MVVSKRFIDSSGHVRTILQSEMKEEDDARKSFNAPSVSYNTAMGTTFVTLEALVSIFTHLRDIQKEMETTSRPVIHLVPPFLCDTNKDLSALSICMIQGLDGHIPDTCTRELAQRTLEEIQNWQMLDLSGCACVLHPSISSLTFMSDVVSLLSL